MRHGSKVSAKRRKVGGRKVYLGYVCIPAHVRYDLFYLDLFLPLLEEFSHILPPCRGTTQSCGKPTVRQRKANIQSEGICLIGNNRLLQRKNGASLPEKVPNAACISSRTGENSPNTTPRKVSDAKLTMVIINVLYIYIFFLIFKRPVLKYSAEKGELDDEQIPLCPTRCTVSHANIFSKFIQIL